MKQKIQKQILKKIVPVFVLLSIFFAPISVSIIETVSDTKYGNDVVIAVEPAVASACKNPANIAACLVESLGTWLGNSIISLAAAFTYAGGKLLDYSVENLVVGFGSWINDASFGKIIDEIWVVVRDISNLLFIFGFIFIGIRLILNGSDSTAKSLLAQLIIAALLVNFSLFITKAIIELSNLIAYNIYKAMTAGGGTIVGGVLDVLDLQGWYSPLSADTTAQLTGGGALWFYVMAAVFLFVTAFTFFNGALMLVSRFVGLVFIMIFSPILFAAQIFPQTKKYASDMWGKLLSYSFYAPAYLLLIFVALVVLQKLPLGSALPKFSETFGSAASGDRLDSYSVVLNFVVAIIIIQAATSLASKLGLAGSQMALNITEGAKKGVRKFVRRNTLDRAGNLLKHYGSRQLRNFEYAGPTHYKDEKTGKMELKSKFKDEDGNILPEFKDEQGNFIDPNKTIGGKLGKTRLGRFALRVDPVLEGIQKGGMFYKNSMIRRAGEMEGLRSSQLKTRMNTFFTAGIKGHNWTKLRKREIMAATMAFLNKQDIDEVDPEIMQGSINIHNEMGLGTTKYIRLRPDVGDPVRYSRDGQEVLFKDRKWVPEIDPETGKPKLDKEGNEKGQWVVNKNKDGTARYLKVPKDKVVFKKEVRMEGQLYKGEDLGVIDYEATGKFAEPANSKEFSLALSQIGQYQSRTKRRSEEIPKHIKSMANGEKGSGTYNPIEGKRDLQNEEMGDSMLDMYTGEQMKYQLEQMNSFGVAIVESLRERPEIGQTTDSRIIAKYFKDLADEAEKRGLDDLANRHKSKMQLVESQAGKRLLGLDQYAGKKPSGDDSDSVPDFMEMPVDENGEPNANSKDWPKYQAWLKREKTRQRKQNVQNDEFNSWGDTTDDLDDFET